MTTIHYHLPEWEIILTDELIDQLKRGDTIKILLSNGEYELEISYTSDSDKSSEIKAIIASSTKAEAESLQHEEMWQEYQNKYWLSGEMTRDEAYQKFLKDWKSKTDE